VQRRVLNSFLRVTGGKPEGIVLLRMRSSVVNSGFVRAEEGAQQLLEGNWGKSQRASYSLGCHHLLQTLVSLVQRKVLDGSLLVGNWGKAGGHCTLSGVIICCKRWSRSCRGKCSTAHCLLVTGGTPEGIVLSRVSSSVANVGLARTEESARQLIACW
jgi:hypothetical protein